MSINDVLKSVKAILQIHDDFHPLIYAIGTKDNTAIILDHLPQPHKKHEREQAFEISGIKAASTYDLGELTQVYFVRQITVQSSDDLKEKEIISMDILDLDKNTQQTFTYLIMRKEAGRVSLLLQEDVEFRDPWANPSLLPAFVKGYQHQQN